MAETAEKLEKWLGPPPPMMRKQPDMQELCQERALNWLLNCEQFVQWQPNHSGMLWIYDIAVLETRKQILGLEHPDTLVAMSNLAATYRKLGKFRDAGELQIAVLTKRKQILGPEHPKTVALKHVRTFHRDSDLRRIHLVSLFSVQSSNPKFNRFL
ncbi:hypothetical protein C8J57DRAFT_1186377 [Mycena rebaudengoi]|nr:hypothetical protein C8J57DRAFT_1186377 [Mycena rebaudengoi]